jgi:putative membrane protein
MFIDYITLMLINLAAGLFLLAAYVYRGLDDPIQKRWIPGFGVVGAIALVTGLHMIFTWTIPGSFNIAFGETSVLFGVLFTATAWSLAVGWELITLAVYGFFAGLAATLIGIRIINLGLTQTPLISGAGFILTGLGGIFAVPTLHWKSQRSLRVLGAIILVLAALIFTVIGLRAYWAHLAQFSTWKPLPMRSP